MMSANNTATDTDNIVAANNIICFQISINVDSSPKKLQIFRSFLVLHGR